MTVITGPCARVASVSGLHATVSARLLFLRHYCLVPDTFSALFVDHAMLIPCYVEVPRMTLSRIEPHKNHVSSQILLRTFVVGSQVSGLSV